MAKQHNPQISARKDSVTQITDTNGNIIAEIGLHEYTVKLPNGTRIHRRVNENITLEDGTMWNPGLMAMAKIYVGVCPQCRRFSFFDYRSHGLVAIHRAKLCVDGCGQLLCPRHARLGHDKKWRCKIHHWSHLFKHFLKTIALFIFFERRDS